MAQKKWMQGAQRKMQRKGTVGAFSQYCGGKVTDSCIERALNSNNETLRRRAQFARNMRRQDGGMATPNTVQSVQPIQPQPIQQDLQQPQLQQPMQPAVDPNAAAPSTEVPAGVNVATDVAGAAGNTLAAGEEDASSKKVAGAALGSAAKGAAIGANPALVAATGGLSIAAGAIIG